MIERQRPQSKVSLEDILRLKRAERPQPEFWAEFEDQLRRKQLAAIVDRRPWWSRLFAATWVKISLPVGATAAVAFTLVAVRDRTQPVSVASADNSSVVASQLASEGTVVRSAEDQFNSSVVATADEVSATSIDPTSSSSFAAPGAASAARSETESGSDASSQDAPELSLAQVIMGINGAIESDARPHYRAESSSSLASLDGLANAETVRVSSLPSSSLSQVSAPRDDRRARLLASIDSSERDLVSGNSRVTRSRDRIASRLTDQALYDSISRLGLNGDSVSIKF